jgi:hypothetical protein
MDWPSYHLRLLFSLVRWSEWITVCLFFLVERRCCEARTTEWYIVPLVEDATYAKRRRCGEDKPSLCYFRQYPNTPLMTTMRVSYRFPFFLLLCSKVEECWELYGHAPSSFVMRISLVTKIVVHDKTKHSCFQVLWERDMEFLIDFTTYLFESLSFVMTIQEEPKSFGHYVNQEFYSI